ncbi:MAG: PSD1 and planctomycete cytochrome C domain-containing protein, partial [Planctomycetota bacterium]
MVDFRRDIEPVLRARCLSCHGADEQNGGLRFDAPRHAMAEGDSGQPAIVAGKPDQSELLFRVQSTDEYDQMPPDGERLTEDEINQIREWIQAGASWPASANVAVNERSESNHWAFQPIGGVLPPDVEDADWAISPIDQFVQARREAEGLSVAADAEPVALIRRASYALTGLPPTPAQVRQFVESSTSAQEQRVVFAQLVDDLLGRREYGERWGRHWMDWVRYADTAGDNSDYPIPQAYLYRNYVIDSLNRDVPYDRFLTEQIAGDLLPADSLEQRNRQRIATGYLAMARRFGSLVERYPWHLTIEDTIDNLGKTMLGMTLACARCHDHKFDPVSTRDYYGLYGIFASTKYPFPGIELFQTQHQFVSLLSDEETDALLAEHQEETKKLEAELNRLLQQCEQRGIENAAREKSLTLSEQRKQHDELERLKKRARNAGTKLAKHLLTLPEYPTAYAVQDADPVDARIQLKGERDRPGAEVPRKFPAILGGQVLPDDVASSASGRLQLAEWITSTENPLTARVIVNRVWQRHFGRGLVPSTSDFGVRGEPPTHPKLLDWLATDFMQNGWSLKHLHRRIMNSRTYQLASTDVRENLPKDPNNHFLWKFKRQRLDAESLRDTLLMISGRLDRSPQTDPHPFPPRDQWTFTQHHPFKDEYSSDKRSVYLMTKRLTAKPYFQTFDGPDPNVCTSSRDQSVTALQALYFVNDQFLHDQASLFADQVVASTPEPQQRAKLCVETILCRPIRGDERQTLLAHVAAARERLGDDPSADTESWA